MAQSHLWLCHWERIEGRPAPHRGGSSLFWICEHPYRTIREDGPSEDCVGCPVWEAMERDRRHRSRKKQPALSGGSNLVFQHGRTARVDADLTHPPHAAMLKYKI
jgi:hypothetical protein